jgi:hypothetical protein
MRKDGLPSGSATTGWVARFDGRTEYWLTDSHFTKIVGGLREAKALKAQLASKVLIATTGTGKNRKFAVKRPVPGLERPYVIAIGNRPRRLAQGSSAR